MSRRKAYSLKEKIEIINKVKGGVSKASISREYGIPQGTVKGWFTEEAKLNSFVDKLDGDTGLTRKKTRLGKNEEVDNDLYTWFLRKRSEGVIPSRSVLKSQAEKFHENMNLDGSFKASDGWLWRWQKRHGISEFGKTNLNSIQSATCIPKQLFAQIKEESYIDTSTYKDNETALKVPEQIIIDSVCCKEEIQEELEDDKEAVNNITNTSPTTEEALTAIETLMQWVESQENINCIKLIHLACLKSEIETMMLQTP